jgi:hypothetical protein
MISGTEPEEELTRQAHAKPGEDIPTWLTRGVVDGFTEAANASPASWREWG